MTASIPRPLSKLEHLPTEIIDLIVKEIEANDQLDTEPSCTLNLRLASRRLQRSTFDAFAKRFFTMRKHMISRRSLQALRDIANDAELSSYVREVVIGPERVNSRMQSGLERRRTYEEKAQWTEEFGAVYEQLIQEQEEFDQSDEATSLLEAALQGFRNLRVVRSDAFPYGLQWTSQSWGSQSIFRQLGKGRLMKCSKPSAYRVFVDWAGYNAPGFPNLHRHGKILVRALYNIRNRKEWTLDIGLNVFWQREASPFDLDTPEWKAVQSRIRNISLIRINNATGRRMLSHSNWMVSVLADCQLHAESLTLAHHDYLRDDLLNTNWPYIKHLTLQCCGVADTSLEDFLQNRAHLLEKIECSGVLLADRNWRYPDQNTVENISWFRIFKIMLTMPRLTAARLEGLSQEDVNKPTATYGSRADAQRAVGGAAWIVATGSDIVLKLSQAIVERVTVASAEGRTGEPRAQIWFSEASRSCGDFD